MPWAPPVTMQYSSHENIYLLDAVCRTEPISCTLPETKGRGQEPSAVCATGYAGQAENQEGSTNDQTENLSAQMLMRANALKKRNI